MPRVTFIAHDGGRRDVEADEGRSLMEAAVGNGVSGILADCGGACACATCHVYVPAEWRARLPPRGEEEESALEFAIDVRDDSRLACQIVVTAALDGLSVGLPRSQF
ncbi:2Fe-2S iron-sulfur cluster-binding protein [Luteimonas saliphila]|uniref:2Fe-2S iron-sulfur cluster-binding protein n=1 Tax=Luteimonas saliphila TaxID=2804919 RepID=UPI00192D1E50